jgi:NhaP-type Na+/H+ or K+/H+ antiporter
MTVTIPLVFITGVVAYACYRYMGLKLWPLLVCILLGFLLAATSAAPDIQNFLNAILHGARK